MVRRMSTATIDAGAPPLGVETDAPKRMKITFSGSSMRLITEAARRLHLTRGDFVREAVLRADDISYYEARGFHVVVRNDRGEEYKLAPLFTRTV